MSKSAFSGKVFAIYLFVLGPVLILAPNFLLTAFGIAPTTEVCVIDLCGGIWTYYALKADDQPSLNR